MDKRREEGSGGGERRTEEIGEDRRGEAKDRMKSLLKNLCVCVGEGGVAMVRPRRIRQVMLSCMPHLSSRRHIC